MFVGNYSDFTYVRFVSKLDTEAIVEDKLEFEMVFDSYGVIVLLYHAYNGLFDTNKCREVCNTEKHTLIFCGVNACCQNGKSDNIIKYLTT